MSIKPNNNSLDRVIKAETKTQEKTQEHLYTIERSYNLLNQLATETQHGIEVTYTQEPKSHSHTLSFLNQSIKTTQKTKHKKTLIAVLSHRPNRPLG